MQPETENLISYALKTLNKEYVGVGKTRVRSWHALPAVSVVVGF